MNNRIIKKLVLDKSGGDKRKTRLLCGRLSGLVGILLNFALGLVKVFVGMLTGSVAVTADAVNNLSDAAASVITIVGFSLASRKSDAEHPFGHARFEYMTGVLVSALVIVVGAGLIIAGYNRIVTPLPLISDPLSILLLVALALVKLWLFTFNIKLSKLIGSPSLKATGIDSRNDAIISITTLLAIILFKTTGLNIDGYVGVVVGGFVIYSGLNMVKETAGPLLGQSPDPETVREIADLVLGHEGVLGIHDLVVHDYGPGHIFASVHIGVDSREDVFVAHALVDDIEKKAQDELHVFLVGHMDPVDTHNPRIPELYEALSASLSGIKGVIGIHDLRLVVAPGRINVIFDVMVKHEDQERSFKEAEKAAQETLAAIDPIYSAVIVCDLDLSGGYYSSEN